MVYPAAVLLPTLAAVSVVFNIAPLKWQCKARNIPAASLLAWLLILNLFTFVNALLWADDDNIDSWFSGVGLCDVEVKIIVGSAVGIIGSALAIMIHLAGVLDTANIELAPNKAKRMRRLALDFWLCWGFAALLMALHYVVQLTRFAVTGIVGCVSFDDRNPVTLSLIWIWPPVLVTIAVYYSVLVVIRIHRHRREMSNLCSMSNTNKARFMRLFIIALIFIIALNGLVWYVFAQNLSSELHPFDWSYIHNQNEWYKIQRVPSEGVVAPDSWIWAGGGIITAAFFGTGKEAMARYKEGLIGLGAARLWTGWGWEERNPTSTSDSVLSSLGSRVKLVLRKNSDDARGP